MAIPFVGRRFTPDAFRTYLAGIDTNGTFRPRFVTLHHTAAPSLAQRPNGFTDQHLQNLRSYYGEELGWSGAPHLFIDDRPDGIIVFQRMDRRGVHAVSFNSNSWGVEMLGFYDSEPFDSGRGAEVRDAAMTALAIMCQRLGVGPDTIKFHRDDPKTNKSCPGRLVKKADVVNRVAALMHTPAPAEMILQPGPQEWTVILPGGSELRPLSNRDGRPTARIRQVLDLLAPGGTYRLLANRTTVEWTPKGKTAVIALPVAEIDENNASYSYLRNLAEAAGHQLKLEGRKITIV